MKIFLKRNTIVYVCFVLNFIFFGLSYVFASEIDFVESLKSNKLAGKLSRPFAVYVNSRKGEYRIYVADTGNNRLVSYDSKYNFVATFNAGGKLKKPISLVKTSHGHFIVIGEDKSKLIFIDIPKKIIRPFNIKGVPEKTNPVLFGRLAIDKNDNLYLTDRGNGRILVFNPNGQFMKEIMVKNRPVDFSDVRVGNNGFIYSLSTIEGKVYIFNKKGEVISIFGQRGNGKHHFLFPTSIAIGHDGLIYVLDQHKATVMVFDINGIFKFKFSKKGQGAGEIYLPSYLFADGKGKIYIVDRGNNRVQIFKAGK